MKNTYGVQVARYKLQGEGLDLSLRYLSGSEPLSLSLSAVLPTVISGLIKRHVLLAFILTKRRKSSSKNYHIIRKARILLQIFSRVWNRHAMISYNIAENNEVFGTPPTG